MIARVSGKMAYSELVALQRSAAEIIRRRGKVRILVIAENFLGWEKDGKWDEDSFQVENDPYIERMAIVGEKKWEELALLFVARGLRSFPIEYFQPVDLARARAWLAGG